MHDFRRLLVWQRAHGLALSLYEVTEPFPMTERFGLQSQIRRAAASIAANVAEGCGRASNADLARFCAMARGSASELENHLLLAAALDLLSREQRDEALATLQEIKRMLTKLIGVLSTKY